MGVGELARGKTNVDTEFGRWLLRQMDREGYNRTGLAAKLSIDHSAVSQWISGKTEPSDANIKRLARVLRVPVGEVYTALGRVPPSPEEQPEDINRMAGKLGLLSEQRRRMVERLTDDLLDEQESQEGSQ